MSHVTIQLHELVVIDKTNVLVYNWDAWEATLAEDAIASFERLNLKDLPRLPGAAASASSTMQSQETSEKHGDTCYKIGEYELAKKHYDAALRASRMPNPILHLKRANVFLKLKHFVHAKKDASVAIKLRSTTHHAYVVFTQAMIGQHGRANVVALWKVLDVLEKGLGIFKPGTDAHTETKKLRDNCVLQIRKVGKRFDFLTGNKVPDEISKLIFENLDCGDIAMCMQVNKYWRDWLDHTPENFKSLTSVGRIVIPPTSLYRWISPKKSSVAALISITIRLPSNQNIDHLRMLEKAASLRSAHFIIETHDWPATDYLPSQLEELRISGSGSISDAILSRVLSKLRSLTYADFGFVDFSATMPVGPPLSPKLETMIFGARTAGTLAPNFQTFIRQFPNMKRFSIAGFNLEGAPNLQQLDFREWRKLTELSLDYCLLKRFPLQFPSQLEVLSLYNTKMCNFNYALATSINDYYTNNLKLCERGSKGYFPRLKRLNLHGSDFQAFYYVYSFAGLRNGSLTDLYIGDTSRCAEEDDPYLENWPQLLPHPSVKLEVLSIDTVYVSENVIRQCLRRYPRLKVIILSETKATGSVIRDLMRRRQPPIFIDVRNTLMANDARVYATSNGAAVYHDQCRRNFYVRPIRESNELSDESKEWLLDWYRRILPPPAS